MKYTRQVALITETFPPLRSSAAVQLRDLSREFIRQGCALTVILAAPEIDTPWKLEETDGVRVLRLKSPRTRDTNYVRRTIGEFITPFAMRHNLNLSPLANERWDGVIWYSPSIFHGPLVSTLKKRSDCKAYLIIRDVFPEWAVDIGLMGRGLPYLFFNAVAQYQYSVADIIGIQTPGNSGYFHEWTKNPNHRLEVLYNWLDRPANVRCSIRISDTSLAGRKIFVYAGNMGVAQGMDTILDLANEMRTRSDVGFLFVGRGSDLPRLKKIAEAHQLDNVLFHNEIDPDEIPDLYTQCSVGIVALDPRHKSHNIPGKFLTYMQSGLPTLATVNPGNDIAKLIRTEGVGQVCEGINLNELHRLAELLITQIEMDSDSLSKRCLNLFERDYTVQKAAKQILAAL